MILGLNGGFSKGKFVIFG
ncbi:hypothetical protein CP10743SC13_2295, partial [Chlamydia psittaci 10_743_SC13]